nr:hypothetical protein [Tanacetum cinerariifolium]
MPYFCSSTRSTISARYAVVSSGNASMYSSISGHLALHVKVIKKDRSLVSRSPRIIELYRPESTTFLIGLCTRIMMSLRSCKAKQKKQTKGKKSDVVREFEANIDWCWYYCKRALV